MDKSSIQIPCPDGFVEVFPDELPIDVNDIIECLQGEFAPLKVWRNVAVTDYLMLMK